MTTASFDGQLSGYNRLSTNILILMPAYNEGSRIGEVVRHLRKMYPNYGG